MICAFQDYENLYLVMDLLTGGDLRYHISKRRRFSELQTSKNNNNQLFTIYNRIFYRLSAVRIRLYT